MGGWYICCDLKGDNGTDSCRMIPVSRPVGDDLVGMASATPRFGRFQLLLTTGSMLFNFLYLILKMSIMRKAKQAGFGWDTEPCVDVDGSEGQFFGR